MKTKMMLLAFLKQPTTIKELQGKSGVKWANLSLHLKDLLNDGFIIYVGMQGKSKVLQINKFKVEQYLKEQEDALKTLRQELIV